MGSCGNWCGIAVMRYYSIKFLFAALMPFFKSTEVPLYQECKLGWELVFLDFCSILSLLKAFCSILRAFKSILKAFKSI